eukprot:g34981.t1
MDKLRSKLIFQRELRDCCVLCFMEIWFIPAIPNCSPQADGSSTHCRDCMAYSGNTKDGGICLPNTSLYSDVVTLTSLCSPDLEYLKVKCRPYYLLHEFTSAILTAVYILPHIDVKNALDEIYTATNIVEMKFPEALFIVAGNFNQANLKRVMPNLQAEAETGGTLYKRKYDAGPRQRNSISGTALNRWSGLGRVQVFSGKSRRVATTILDSISKCVEGCMQHSSQTIQTFTGDPDMDLHKAIRDAKRQYRTKLEAQTNKTDSRHLWQSLHNITGYNMKQDKIADKDTSLPEALNAFYTQFEQNTTGAASPALTAPDAPVPTVTAVDIRSPLLGVNQRKVMGLDGLPGRALGSCADQLAEVFSDIFNLSLLQAEIPVCFEKTTIIPVPKKT